MQAYDEYKKIVSLYPNGTIYAWEKDRDVRVMFYSWLNDRQVHGLYNTVYQFVGINLTKVSYDDDPSSLLKI